MKPTLHVFATLLTLGLVACGGGTSAPVNTGQLTVSFTAPGGVSTSATVTGPGGYSNTLTTNTTLSSLAPGTYTITPASVRRAGASVDEFYDGTVTGGTASVTNNASASSNVTFARRGGSGKLWLPGCETTAAQTGQINGYDASALAATSTPIAAATFANGACTEGMAFDTAGDLWISDYVKQKISMYTPAQLASTPVPAPSVVLSNPADPTSSFYAPADIGFDKGGNLWVVNFLNSKLVAFTPVQLAASGSPVPSVVLGSTTYAGTPSLGNPVGLAFDGGGNLWVGNAGGSNVVKFTASSLAASGTPAPVAQITDYTTGGGHTLNTIYGLAIDSGGFLWTSNFSNAANANRVSKYDVSALSGSSMAAPVTILNMAAGVTPINIGFDNAGALWIHESIGSPASSKLLKFNAPASFSGVLTPAPDVTQSGLPGRNGYFGRFVFGPTPTNLPLLQQK